MILNRSVMTSIHDHELNNKKGLYQFGWYCDGVDINGVCEGGH